MKKRPYYFEIKNLITQFMGAFNDIAIKRYDKDRISDGEYIGVGFLYSPKQRVINDILTASRNIPLPTISVSISQISRDPERVFNKLQGHVINTLKKEDSVRQIPQPVPINIIVNMSIIARYQSDIEQIISNFIPYCDPYITVSWKLPTTEDTAYEKEIRTIIEWGGTLNMQYPVELASNQLARVSCDTSFTIKGWIFKQIDNSFSKIYQINTNFMPSLLDDQCYVYNNTTETGSIIDTSNITESFVIKGRPVLKNIDCSVYYIGKTDTNFIYNLYGENLSQVTDVYLRTITPNLLLNSTTQAPFAGSHMLSLYPDFNGLRISTFKVISDNSIKLTIPANITTSGNFDIVAKNDAGYGLLSTDSTLPAHDSSIDLTHIPHPYQPLCTNGITVL